MKIFYENGQGIFIGVSQRSLDAVMDDLTLSENDQVVIGYGLSRNLNGWEDGFKEIHEAENGEMETFFE